MTHFYLLYMTLIYSLNEVATGETVLIKIDILAFLEFHGVSEKGIKYLTTQVNYQKSHRCKNSEVLIWLRRIEKVFLKK